MKFLTVFVGLVLAVGIVGSLALARDGGSSDPPAGRVDISGPCDEAEHANDPRCTGAQAPAGDDRSGHGSDDSGHGSDDSGHGSDDSGHGSDDG
jgi:hypothetical protein